MSYSVLSPDSEDEQKRQDWKKWLFIIAAVLVSIGVAVAGFWWAGILKRQDRVEARQQKSAEELRNMVVYFMAQPKFSGEQFEKQVLGKGNLEWFDMANQEVYFSLPQLSEEEKNEALQVFLTNLDKIELADLRGDRMSLGDIYLRKSPEKDMFFRTKLKNVKIKTDTVYEFNFERAKYTLTLPELNEYFNNKMIFGGRLYADTSLKMYGLPIVFSNHGAFVARPNEPSLQRFVTELLKDVPDNREQKVQRLLDFVSNEIEYNFTEAIGYYETLKRPTEVLMSRNGDCSNKTILLASLLEQIGEEYLLFYSPRHITVGVKQGNFPNENGLFYTWENQNWLIAESTYPGFQIGKTPINDDKIKQAEYVQATKFRDAIYDVKDSGRRIDFK